MFVQLFIIASALLGQISTSTMPKPTSPQMQQKMAEQQKGAAAAPKAEKQSPDILLIDPAARAKDWVSAYQYLSAHAGGKTISFKLENGQTLNSISEVKALEGGTLLTFTLNTTQGTKYKIVKVEDISDIVIN